MRILRALSASTCWTRLVKGCRHPLWHDDQQGTATVTLAGLINAAKLTSRDVRKMKITLVGVGAAKHSPLQAAEGLWCTTKEHCCRRLQRCAP